MPLPRFDKGGVAATKTEREGKKAPRQAEMERRHGDWVKCRQGKWLRWTGQWEINRVGMSKTDLLELLDGTLVDTTALVDEMAGL